MIGAVVIGLDLAKNVFQIRGVATDGAVIARRQLRRGQVIELFASQPPCLVGMEACASAHHLARKIAVLAHLVRLMPPAYVKASVRRGKTDAEDAEAISEAVKRPTMRFAIKSKAQQAAFDSARDPRSSGATAHHAHQRAPRSPWRGPNCRHRKAAARVRSDFNALYLNRDQLPELARAALGGLTGQFAALGAEIDQPEARIVA